MSDLSIIAHDYELNAEFARKFNDAVLNLKRVYLLRRAVTPDTHAEVEKSRSELRQLLDSLVLALQDEGKSWTADQAQVPADVLDRLHKRLKGELPETVLELRRVAESLAEARNSLRLASQSLRHPLGGEDFFLRLAVRRVAHFELLERGAKRLAELEIGFRPEADRRDPRPADLGMKRIRNLGERWHVGPPLCDPTFAARQASGAEIGRPAL